MTTDDTGITDGASVLEANLGKIEELSARLVAAMGGSRQVNPGLSGPGQDLYMRGAAAYWSSFMADPAKVMEHQVSYWGRTLQHYMDAQAVLGQGTTDAPAPKPCKDRRFSNPMWETNAYFKFLKDQYLINSEAVTNAINSVEGLEEGDRKRLDYFSKQIVDMMAPTNFLGSNPDALTKAAETQGQSLVDGLENLVRDLEANNGDLVVTLADKEAFKVGENLATTKGGVVFRNRLLELIQFEATTEKVHKTPLVIFPPWINRYYVLDLKEKNSFLKWAVDQGFTVFVASWVNPDASYADVGLDDYITEGYLPAIEAAKAITGEDKVNAIGYCIGGTTLSLTMGLLKKRGDSSIKSATLFTTLTDFSDKGEFGAFLTDDFVDAIEEEAKTAGYLDKYYMSRTFSFLRSNDLIYGPAIKSYMLGEAPPAFDLLYWNGDGTNLPARMAVEYLRSLCQGDELAQGTIKICGETLSLDDVTVPICAIACETDHIAAWKDSYRGWLQMASKDKTFILSESGHIAGIVNPPTRVKYGHYTNAAHAETPEAWQDAAERNEGSWWPTWSAWLAKKSGARIKARPLGSKDFKVLCPAPGTYVCSNSND
ncbi:class I poly(R)-hydroxyalkanoic acid synthase [Alphaproteobacteria bacterium KMM 3653]|uniref:Class I poly(R)-hydroxyalkanoic acid synthase n=1 Tax=Harenicola maris TaxID=2841044 RepID=A0AAP2GA82_9RHOB|nr:class I poly(R)-hydroxyalkanoic acid synthase [Harenicola maris]